ncbi:MAG TPA: hypothetical protein VGB45_06760 [Abditibacterium sp.]
MKRPFLLLLLLAVCAAPIFAQTAPTTSPTSSPTSSPAVTPTASPTVSPTPAPITNPKTDVPDAPALPGAPIENQPASVDPGDQNRQFEDPNRVLPAPPIAGVATPPADSQIASSTPLGPPIPTAPPVVTAPGGAPNPNAPPLPNSGGDGPSAPLPLPGEGDVASGAETPGGNFSLEAPDGVVYDMERGLALAQGTVTFRYREFIVRGDRGVIDYNTNRATLAGNLTVNVRGQTFRGKSLVFDLDSGRWTLSSLAITFPPEFFPPGTVLEPIYVRDGTVTGDFDTVGGQDFKVSSCDRDHYFIKSKKIEFYRTPGGEPSRIVLRRNAVFLLGRKILPLPVYVISLLGANTRRQPLQTTFGQNSVDGFFARGLYDLRATPKISDSLLIDALQKRGLGLGFQRQYAATAGILYLYGLSGRDGGRELNTRVDRTYQLSRNINSNIRFESQQNTSLLNGQTSQSESRNGTFTFARAGSQAQTNAILGFNSSSFGFGKSENGSISLDHRQDFGRGFGLAATSQLSRSQSFASGGMGADSDSATSDQIITLSKTGKAFDLYLQTELHDDLVAKQSYTLERLPELTLQSSTDRLSIPGIGNFVPGSFTLGVGRFNEPSSSQKKGRADFRFTPLGKEYRLLGQGKSQSVLSATGSFEQAFYSDDTARYNYDYNLTSNSTLGPAQLQINYSKQRTFGFTPFQFDATSPGEYIDTTLSIEAGEKFRFNLSGGRDIQNSFSRDLIARVQFAPNAGIYTSLGTTYRLEDDQNSAGGTRFGDIYANLRLARNRNRFGGGQLGIGVRYSPNGQGLTRANGSLDINLGRKTRVQALAGYDGFAKRFDFTQIRVTRDLHCFNLFATYDDQRKELRFDLALKAFPFADTRFGRNEFSEGFDANVGDVQ